ncbi:heparinase II/III family protein [Sphingomonas panacisoli]|uniref:heparinase II/III family protein n=1 Tax=Sphingomonas panacisoli TaxID=1813879 RepID=UPI00195FAD32|nr:heparinase II/III-family protein [Sphingomonas panacisoli]
MIGLGPINVLRVLGYRLGLRLGVHPAQRIEASIPEGLFFERSGKIDPVDAAISAHWDTDAMLFGAHRIAIDAESPAWTADPLSGEEHPGSAQPWWRIADFANGDIKRIWELSRFDWAMTYAQRARNGDATSFDRLNTWIAHWADSNPPYLGPNWKCAQEASIRVLHLSIAAIVLGQENEMAPPMRAMIEAHVRRIMPTLSYAQAQDNNHATSEAAAIFVAGAWATLAGDADAVALTQKGRQLLERHVARLFGGDGSFSQYSVNYHRVALDTLAIAELWRRRADLPPFSETFQARAAAAADWLRMMVDPASGDAPNLGANDGANLLPLTGAPYRDYRPSVQLATCLFRGLCAYPPGAWDDVLIWLDVATSDNVAELPEVAVFDDGGYAVLRRGSAMALLRYPRFRFRPSHADAMHVDLHVAGCNLLRDGGTYSYNVDDKWIDYFSGIESHNSVQFDDRPQMPRLSRFLLGDWLKTDDCRLIDEKDSGIVGFCASYRHRSGWTHRREMRLGNCLRVTDVCSGFTKHATLRWRLAPGDWTLRDGVVTNGRDRLSVCADVPISSIRLVVGCESRNYLEKTELPVLEVVITEPGRMISEYRWAG